MEALQKDWLTHGWVDFEYKKYILLGYLQNVKSHFGQNKLYPHLADLVFHYRNLISIKQNKELLQENFPKEINKADFEKLKLHYQKMIKDDALMSEIESIVTFAIPHLKETLKEGKELYDFAEDQLELEPIGICPLYSDEGYLLINRNHKKNTKVYQYQIAVFENAQEKYQGIHLDQLDSFRKRVGVTFESMKMELIKKYKSMPNPATYLVNVKCKLPLEATIMPIAKRLLVKYMSHIST